MDFFIDPFADSEKYFKTQLQQFQFFDKYSRFDYDKGRRETWKETVRRAVHYLIDVSDEKLSLEDYEEIYDAILNMEVMPSMRLLAMAGKAANVYPQSIYNCAYVVIDSLSSFVDALNISMNGCGVGFSVESEYVDKLPDIQHKVNSGFIEHKIEDSTKGWCSAFAVGLNAWFNGDDVTFDYSGIREAGTVLKTKGGRASGYKPLKELLDFTRSVILSNDRLTTINAYDIMCKIADCVVSGGVRRTALLCLFDNNDELMLNAKSSEELLKNPHRYNCNNSAVWPDRKLSQKEILQYLMDMDKDGNGEPGIFSRYAASKTIPDRRHYEKFGLNPCGEVFLRQNQFCNLSSVICRSGDTLESLERKVRVATIIGTIQSCVTDFVGISEEWKNNCEEERLLGVDLNGQMDCSAVRNEDVQKYLRMIAIHTNFEYAHKLGIGISRAITLVKPSGNSGVMLDVSSGIHPRWSKYYIRNVRVSKTSPLYNVLFESGVKMSPENGQTEENAVTFVASFPCKSPNMAINRHQTKAIWQLNYWKVVKTSWCEHNPSCTIYYGDDEILDVANWIYDNQDIVGGLSFLPKFDATYPQAPYIEITESEYNKLYSEFPKIDFSLLQKFEDEDFTESARELACSAGVCDLQL